MLSALDKILQELAPVHNLYSVILDRNRHRH